MCLAKEASIPKVLNHFESKLNEPGYSGWSKLDDEFTFAPGTYIPAKPMSEVEVDQGVLNVIRGRTAFVAYHAAELVKLNTENPHPLRVARKVRQRQSVKVGTIGSYFDIVYGQKALHNKDPLKAGTSLVISSSGEDNGCYGFFDFDDILAAPFVTVPSTGSIAVAHVQEWPCGVTDDCLILIPKDDVPHALLYVAAAVVRNEAWRFSYGRKATPERIADFPVPVSDAMVERVNDYLIRAAVIEDQLIENAEDALDAAIARDKLDQLKEGSVKVVRGAELEARLARLMAE